MCLSTNCLSYVEKLSFHILYRFPDYIAFLTLNCSSLRALDILTPYQICDLQIFSLE